jgi:PAS domain S-box-containing protein
MNRKHQQADEALKESEEKYRQIFATVSDAIMLFDGETREFIDVNDSCLSMYGYSKNEFLKLRHYDITDEPEASSKSIKQTLSGETIKIPLRYHKRNGGVIFPVCIGSKESGQI